MVDAQTAALLAELAEMAEAQMADQRFGDIRDARAYSASVFKAFAGPDDHAGEVVVTDVTVGGADGMRPARCYRPSLVGSSPLPVVLFFHGGGWVLSCTYLNQGAEAGFLSVAMMRQGPCIPDLDSSRAASA